MTNPKKSKEIYSYELQITSAITFGKSLDDVETTIPTEGIRQDAYFEGIVSGQKVNGTITGVDYIYVRANGRFELNIHAVITTQSGENITLHAVGIATPTDTPHILRVRQSVTMMSNHEAYKWLNSEQIWGEGQVDMQAGIVKLTAYC